MYRDGESAPHLTREPEKENAGGKKMYYDSVQVCSAVGFHIVLHFSLLQPITVNCCLICNWVFRLELGSLSCV